MMKQAVLRALGALAVSATALGAAPLVAASAESPITLATANGTLQGTLTMPDNASGKIPVVLIVAGSGPTDRDGSNSLGIPVKPYKALATALAGRDIATVRYDKRGVAASATTAPLGTPVTFTSYVDDAAGWMKMLHGDARFSRVVVAGHSEGSLLALLAAAKTPADGVISLEGAGRPALDVVVEQSTAAGAPKSAIDDLTRVGQAIRDGKDPGAIPPELNPLFPVSLRTYEQQWFSTDPAAAARALTTPLLVIQGGNDVQVHMTDAKDLAGAKPGTPLRVFPKMTHVLFDAKGTDRTASLATYMDTTLPLDPGMVDAVAAFALGKPLPPSQGS